METLFGNYGITDWDICKDIPQIDVENLYPKTLEIQTYNPNPNWNKTWASLKEKVKYTTSYEPKCTKLNIEDVKLQLNIYRLGLFGDRFSINDVVKEIYEKEKEKNMSKIWELKDDGNVKETAGELLRLKAANTKATKEDWDRLKKSVTLESVDLDVADVIMYAIDNCNHEVFITCYENSTCVTIKPVKEN